MKHSGPPALYFRLDSSRPGNSADRADFLSLLIHDPGNRWAEDQLLLAEHQTNRAVDRILRRGTGLQPRRRVVVQRVGYGKDAATFGNPAGPQAIRATRAVPALMHVADDL